jgi:hypothetical protein
MGDKHGWHHGGIPGNYSDDALALKTIYMSMQAGEEGVVVILMNFQFREVWFFKNTVGTRKILFRLPITELLVHSQHLCKPTEQDLLIGKLYPVSCQKMMMWDRRTRGTGRIFGMEPVT